MSAKQCQVSQQVKAAKQPDTRDAPLPIILVHQVATTPQMQTTALLWHPFPFPVSCNLGKISSLDPTYMLTRLGARNTVP